MEDRCLSVEETGVYLGVAKDTVYKWLIERDLPAHKSDRFWKPK